MEVGGEGEGERRWRGKRRDGEREGGGGGVVGGGGGVRWLGSVGGCICSMRGGSEEGEGVGGGRRLRGGGGSRIGFGDPFI
jgi:hypothetical protein